MQTVFIAVGIAASSLLPVRATTNAPFSIQQREGISWLIKPNGERFFSFGVCVVGMGASLPKWPARPHRTWTRPPATSTRPGMTARSRQPFPIAFACRKDEILADGNRDTLH